MNKSKIVFKDGRIVEIVSESSSKEEKKKNIPKSQLNSQKEKNKKVNHEPKPITSKKKPQSKTQLDSQKGKNKKVNHEAKPTTSKEKTQSKLSSINPFNIINKGSFEWSNEKKNLIIIIYDYQHKKEKILDFKNGDKDAEKFFFEKLLNIFNIDKMVNDDYSYIICSVPGHKSTKKESRFNNIIEKLIEKIQSSNNIKKQIFFNCDSCLYRFKTIPKLSISNNKSSRAKKVHEDSIKIRNEDKIQNKCAILIDDVVTTGNSMEVCADLLLKSGALSVLCIGFMKTRSLW